MYIFFAIFLATKILAFRRNWTRKQEVGHCDLILKPIFVQFDNSQKQGPINASYKISAKYTILEKKLILVVLLFLTLAAIWILDHAEFYHSEALKSGHAARET